MFDSRKKELYLPKHRILCNRNGVEPFTLRRRGFRYTNNQGRNVIWPPERPKGERKQTGEEERRLTELPPSVFFSLDFLYFENLTLTAIFEYFPHKSSNI